MQLWLLKVNRLNILLALNSFFPNSCAGTELYVLGLARYFRNQNHNVSIIIPWQGTDNSKYVYDGFTIYQYPIPKQIFSTELNGLQNTGGLNYFSDVLSILSPDIIHFHSFNRAMNSDHIRLAHDMGIKTIFTSHLVGLFCARGDLFYKNKKLCDGKVRLQRCMSCYIQQKYKLSFFSEMAAIGVNLSLVLFPWLKHYKPSLNYIINKKEELRKLNKYSDNIISISKWMVNTYALNGIIKTVVACQGVSSGYHRIRAYTHTENKINLIFIGRLYPIKNIELLLDALSEVDKTQFDLSMIVIPTENNMDYYLKIKEKYKLLEYNKWHEKIPAEEVNEFLSSSDLLCLPSISEVAPMVIKEAFDCGVPVLGSDIPPISELVTHKKNGLLFKTNNLNSLKEQLNKLILGKELLKTLKNNVRPMTDIAKVYMTIEKQYKLLISSK